MPLTQNNIIDRLPIVMHTRRIRRVQEEENLRSTKVVYIFNCICCIVFCRPKQVASSSEIVVARYTRSAHFRNHRQTCNDVFPHRWLPLRLRERDVYTSEE